jgi:urea ABC transporter ATP-binding protein UrtD
VLQLSGIHKRFGGVFVIAGLDLAVAEGEHCCIIGPNGAGKTTLFNLVTGRLAPDAGSIALAGRDITGLPVHEITRLGVGRKFQAPAVFDALSVRDNLLVAGTGHRPRRRLFSRRPDAALAARAEEVLDRIRLARRGDEPAGDLSHGQKQWLEIGMVMLSDPRLVLLDEPTAGMTAAETAETADLIARVFAGRTAVIIEHDVSFVRRLDTRVVVLHRGTVMRDGSFSAIAADEAVRRVYLGEEA